MAILDIQSILVKVSRAPKVKEYALSVAEGRLETAKEKMIEELDANPVTQELEGGETASSKVLPGGYGNLFSFIGFYKGETPIDDLKQLLENNIKLRDKANGVSFIKGNQIQFKFNIEYPSIQDIEDATPYPGGDRDGSWIHGIEHGIFGFSSYLFDEDFENYPQSRSETALQAKTRGGKLIIIRKQEYKPRRYITKILEDFAKTLRNIK